MLNDKNPIKVQSAPRGQAIRPTPLLLIHDGGGTTFGYFSLGSLGRDVWALHNPKYFTSEQWDGGIDEMVKHYIDLIKGAGIRGTIFLGGWSLGGYLSMAIARSLATEPSSRVRVAGILLMDSPFLVCGAKLPSDTPAPDVQLLELVQKSLDNCHEMLHDWELPAWGAPACGGKSVRFTTEKRAKSFVVPSKSAMYKPMGKEWISIETGSFEGPEPQQGKAALAGRAILPPGVLLRSVDRAPPKGGDKGVPCRVDVFRDETLLGWDHKHLAFIKAVIDTPSHHYGLFNQENMAHVTATVNNALEILTTIRSVM